MWKYFAQNFKKYLALRGRTTRIEFWSFVTCSLILLLTGVAIAGFFLAIEHFFQVEFKIGSLKAASIGVFLFLITALVLVMPFISIAVRRVHDAGLTGWLILVPGVNLILWCMPSKNSGNYFDDDNVFEPSRIIGLSLIWAGFIASIFYAIAAAFLINGKLSGTELPEENIQEKIEVSEASEDTQAEESFTEQVDDSKAVQETEKKSTRTEADRTEGYDGEVLDTEQLEDGTLITLRRHTQTLTVRMIQDTNIYDSMQNKIIVGSISIPQEIKVTGIAKTVSLLTTANTTDIWLRIDDNGFDGYLHAGPISDPYENDFYTVLDHIDFADEKWTVRNIGEKFYAFRNGAEILDVPGKKHSSKIGVIELKGDETLNLSISAITEETTEDSATGISYPWLRLDSDGKSGWIYGKYAVTETGSTPEFPSAKRTLEMNLQ